MKSVGLNKSTIIAGFRLFVISLFLLFTLTASYAVRSWTFDDDVTNGIPVDGAVKIDVQNLGIGHLKVRFSEPSVKMEPVELNKRVWTLVTIDGETRLWQNGKPALPLISRPIRLPNTGNVKLDVTYGEYDEYTNIDVLPQQPTDLKKVDNRLEPVEYSYDESVYSQDAWYPSQPVVMTDPEVIRDARVSLLGVQPVIYNPVTHTLRVYKSIDVETTPNGGMGQNELLSDRMHPVPSFAGIYEDIIGADDLVDDARAAPPGQILFIARSGPDTLIKPWTDWKTQSGHPCQIYTCPSTTTSAATLQTTITNAYNTYNPPLESVMLIGDGGPGASAPYEIPTYSDGSGYYSDHRYGMIVTGSINVSFWIGRIHCDNASELQMQIAKSMNYERIPVMTDTTWFTHGWGYAGTSNNIVSNPPCIHFCLNMMQARGVNNVQFDTHPGAVDANLINTRLSPGATYWAHRAGWISQIQPSNVSGINNINKPFVGFNISCGTGAWNGPTATGIHVALTKLGTVAQPRGAIASVSTQSSGTNPAHNNVMAAGSMYGLGVRNGRMPGPMFFEGKFQLWRNYRIGDSLNASNFIFWNNPLGDNTAMVWTGVPRYVTGILPDTIGIGQNRLSLQLSSRGAPLVGAMVTAWKKSAVGTNETYTRGVTDDSGRVLLTLSNTTVGRMFLTVSGNQVGQNVYPLVDTVQVVQRATDLAYNNVTIVDDTSNGRSGNNNGAANPGETVDVTLQLINRGSSVATGISGTLSSSDPRVTIVNATASWNANSAGTTAASTTPFRVHLLTGIRDNEVIPLQLNLVTAQGNRSITYPLTVRSIALAYISSVVNPSTINPGQSGTISVTVRNNGGLATGSTVASLFSLSPYLLVTTPNATFPSLPLGSNVANPPAQLFQIVTNGRTIPGTIANLGVTFTSGSARDTVYFNVTIGNRTSRDPAGPDPYGYLAYDNTDTLYRTLLPTYNWIDLIPGINSGTGTRLPINANVIQANSATNDQSVVVRLPFTARYYGLTFDSVTICNNGWLAFGAQPDFNNCRNWHLPPHEGPRNIVAVNWCDQSCTGTNEGVYIKNDTTNHQFIVTWKTTTLYNAATGPEEYQLIIYNPNFSQTPTGDSPLKFQYKTFNPQAYSGGESGVSYATVGISDNTYTRGLEYCYWNLYNPGCASIPTGTPTTGQRAILFTTAQPVTGNLTGTVRRASDNSVLRNVNILALNGGRNTTTDSLGHYTMNDMQIGNYRVQASIFGYNTFIDTVTIRDSLTSTLNFTLTNPSLRLSVRDTTVRANDSIVVDLLDSGQVSTQHIYIRNTGNGPLTWNSSLIYSGNFDEVDSLWNPVTSMNISQTVADNQISGVEFDGTNFWVTGANNYSYPHHVYKLDHDGHLLATYNCPDQTGLYGWRDLAWDGHYLYGSYSNYIDQIAVDSFHVVQRFPVNVNPARAIAVDTAAGVIYYCDQASAIYKIRLSNGAALGTLPNPSGGGVYGLTWYPNDPEGRKLYAFSRDSVGHSAGARIYRIDPVTGSSVATIRLGSQSENAGGLCVTPRWNPLLWTTAAVLQSSNGCRLALYELSFNSTWIAFSPQSDSMAAGQWDTVSIALNSRFMPQYRYRVAIRYNTNSITQTVTVPIVMNVITLGVAENQHYVPEMFSLEQNYPNPFNPTTSISFTLPQVAPVKLTIHDELGREVTRLISNETMNPGRHIVTFDGSRLASGVYFYRVEAGKFISTKKMLMLK